MESVRNEKYQLLQLWEVTKNELDGKMELQRGELEFEQRCVMEVDRLRLNVEGGMLDSGMLMERQRKKILGEKS